MSEYTHSVSDLKTLIGEQPYQGYTQQQQDREVLEAYESEPLICYFCKLEITQDQPLNLHHPIYKSNGGTHVEPSHETCHRSHHSNKGDFKEWGKLSSLTRAWAFNLKNVRDNPAYDFDRAYYLMMYAQ
jgi:hypothetical protein